MSEQTSLALGAGVVYEDAIPMSWRPLGALPEGGAAARLQLAAEEVLRGVCLLEGVGQESGDDDGARSPEFARLEAKFNLLMDLLGQVVAQQIGLPERCEVRFSATEVEWMTTTPPPQDLILVELYLSPRYPRAAVLPARVEALRPVDGAVVVRATFLGLGAALQTYLEKIVFRNHRRNVALMRRPPVVGP